MYRLAAKRRRVGGARSGLHNVCQSEGRHMSSSRGRMHAPRHLHTMHAIPWQFRGQWRRGAGHLLLRVHVAGLANWEIDLALLTVADCFVALRTDASDDDASSKPAEAKRGTSSQGEMHEPTQRDHTRGPHCQSLRVFS